MKACLAALLCYLVPTVLLAASPGELTLPDFKDLESRATETVNLSIDPWMLQVAGAFMGNDADSADVKRIMKGVRSIQIRSFEFDKEFAYSAAEIEGVRRQLSAPGWNRLVQTHSAENNENVDIYLLREGEQPRGFALICSAPKEFTIINIVGTVSVQDLNKLQSHVNLSKLRAAAAL